MIDLANEQIFPLLQAAKHLPRGRRGRPVHFSTLLRWVLDGVATPSGARVRLEAVRLGSKWITSAEAIQRFADRLTPAVGDRDLPETRTPGKRQRACERAAEALERAGI